MTSTTRPPIEEREDRRQQRRDERRRPAARARARAAKLLAAGLGPDAVGWPTAGAAAAPASLTPPPLLAAAAGHRDAELLLGRGRRELADDLALVHDEDPVGEREDLLELERDEQDRAALVALLDQPAVDELDRADVEAARRLGGDQDLRVAVDLAREHDLLLVAARERAARASAGRRRARRTPRSASRARSIRRRGKSQPKREAGALAVVVEREVLGDRELEHEPAALAVLGDVAEPGVEVLAARRRS